MSTAVPPPHTPAAMPREPANESVQAQRDQWAAQAHQAWQENAELRQQNTDLANSLRGMVGLVELICASSEISAHLGKTIKENHRFVTARAVLEKVRV